MVRKFHLISFFPGGTHIAVGLCASSLTPFHGILVLQQGQAVPSCLFWLGSSFLTRESSFVFPLSPQPVPGMVQGVFGSSQAGLVWGMAELERCRGIKTSFSNKCNYTNMLEPCVLFNFLPEKIPQGTAFVWIKEIPQCLRHPLWILSGSSVPWVATNIGLQIPLKNSYPSRSQEFCARQGFCGWQSPWCPADLTGSWHCWLWLPARVPRGIFCPLRCLCSVERILLQSGIFPRKLSGLWCLSTRQELGRCRRAQPKEGRDPPQIVLCDVELLLTKEITIIRGPGGKTWIFLFSLKTLSSLFKFFLSEISWDFKKITKHSKVPGEVQSKGLNDPEKLFFWLPQPLPLGADIPWGAPQGNPCTDSPALAHKPQMFNSVCACQSALKIQVALGACQAGSATGWCHSQATLGCAWSLQNCLSMGMLSQMWGREDVPALSGLVWLLCGSLVHLHLPLGLAPLLKISQWEYEVCTHLQAFCAITGCVCLWADPNPSAWFSLWLCNSQGEFTFEKRFWPIFGSPQVRLRSGVKFINTKRVKRDFCRDRREKTQLWSSTLGLYGNTGNSRCVLWKGQVLELENSCLFPLKQPTEVCFLAFQSFQGSQGRAYLFNSVWVPRARRIYQNPPEKGGKKTIIPFRKHLPGTAELPKNERGRNSPWFIFEWCWGFR